jgi:uncharacterized repeat protein (TIGR01451 family)
MVSLFRQLAHRITAIRAVLLLVTVLVLGMSPAAFASPPASGTMISNTATGSYVDSATGISVRLTSNTVQTIVQPLEAVTLTSSQSVMAAAGSKFVLSHQLSNTGNTSLTCTINSSVVGGSFAATNLSVVEDVNGNGVVDPGEPVIPEGGTISLTSGQQINLLNTGEIPATATIGQNTQVQIACVTQLQHVHANNTDTITVSNGPAISVTKSASTQTPTQGSTLSYTLSATNTGSGAAMPAQVQVNGAAASLFVLRDDIPANTTFAHALPSGTSQQLYHRVGDPASSYVTGLPALNMVDGVAWGLPSLAPGATLTTQFSVTVNSNASGTIANTGYADYVAQGANFSAPSNAVNLPLPALPPSISFYNPSYSATVAQSALGSPLYVQFNAAQCNTDPTRVLTYPVTLVSQLTGDTETFQGTETAANSGVFRILPDVPTANGATHVVSSGDHILEVLRNDTVVATITGCGGSGSISSNLLIDPSGVVFDSKSNQPVAGTTVALIDVTGAGNGGQAGGPAKVLEADGSTSAPSTVVTDSTGVYMFPLVAASTYRLMITPPAGYSAPSKLPPGLLPAGRHVDANGSYERNFVVAGQSPVSLDLPLDAGAATTGLFIEKTASKSIAEIGDFVDYTVTLSNRSGVAMPAATLDDHLPAGFAYVKGTARLNGQVLTDPVGGGGPNLVFGIGNIAINGAPVLTYRVRIGPGGQSGNGTNTAQAISGQTRSNVGSAKVQVSGGVFSDSAYLIGKVFVDCNGNHIQDADEPGVPGVRIYLEDGTFAVTDGEGKYSLYGLLPRTHVAKLDTTTLPDGAVLEVLDNRNAGDAGSQFVDLQNGELHKTDFALSTCTPALRKEIAARHKAMHDDATEITQAAQAQLSASSVAVSDPRTLSASGVIGLPGSNSGYGSINASTTALPGVGGPAGFGSAVSAPGTAPAVAAATPYMPMPASAVPAEPAPSHVLAAPPSLEKLLPTLDATVGFVGLNDGDVLPADQISVRVKGPLGAKLLLSVNGQEVPSTQVGQQSSLESHAVTAWEYIGVNLAEGDNLLEVVAQDSFGNARSHATIHVIAPGKLARIQLDLPKEAKADGHTPVNVTVHLLDAHGVPITARTELSLESSVGTWQSPDLDPNAQGTQVFVEGGVGRFALLPPGDPGTAHLRISSGLLHSESDMVFLPDLRPMIAAGLVEGALNLRNLNPAALSPAQSGDGFESEIQGAQQSFDHGKDSATVHSALFLKGKVKGSYLLTLAYDSDKPGSTTLFRDINPDSYYPVYGDSSAKGYEAQSTGKLYVRIDHGTSYALYGDYSTQSDNPARVLTQYNRALNGAKTHVEDGRLTVDGFVSDTNSVQVVDVIPANGTSGPYQLSSINGLANSEQVDIITRDRNQPALIVSDVPMTRLTDYEIEPYSGQILFKAPIASLDANLNPIFVRITYEVSNGGPNFWVAGVDARDKLLPWFTLGGTYIHDGNPADPASLRGANFLWNMGPTTSLVGEVAQSQSEQYGTGDARRFEFRHSDPSLQARVYAVQSDTGFNNASSTVLSGGAEYGAKVGYALTKTDRLVVNATKTTTSLSTGQIEDASVGIEHSLPMNMKLTGSVRHVSADEQASAYSTAGIGDSTGTDHYTSGLVRLDAPVPNVPKANAFLQYEQAVDDASRRNATVGATYQLGPQTKFYVTHETSNSLTDNFSLNSAQNTGASSTGGLGASQQSLGGVGIGGAAQNYSTVIGVTTPYMTGGQLFNEYRIGDSIDGRTAENAVGLRNQWHPLDGLGVNASLEQVHPVTGAVTDEATAVTGSLSYTASPDWKGSARAEWSESQTTRTWLATIGAAFKVNESVTLLSRGLYNRQTTFATTSLVDDGTTSPVSPLTGLYSGPETLELAQFGMAYRPVDSDVWNLLARVEWKRDQGNNFESFGTDDVQTGTSGALDYAAKILSVHVNYQPSATWTLDGRYAVKKVDDYANSITSSYVAQLIGGRSMWDITSKWDGGVHYYAIFGGGLSAHQQSIGAELGYIVAKNMWLSLGYNFQGFSDQDLAGEDYTQNGVYLRLRFKFDENVFKPSNNAKPLSADAAAVAQ